MPSLNIIRRLWCGQQLTNIQTETNKHSSHLLVFTVRPVSLCWLDISVSSGYTAPKSVYYRTLCKSNMGFVCHRRSMLIKQANKIRAAKIIHETGQVYIPIFPVWYDARGFRGGEEVGLDLQKCWTQDGQKWEETLRPYLWYCYEGMSWQGQ